MRFSHFSVFALSGLSMASPVVTKRADAVSLLTDLYATVQIYTGAINATLAPLSPSSNILDKTAATAQVGAQINLITAAITSTTNEIAALPHINATKRSLDSSLDSVSTDLIEAPKHEKRQLIAVAALLSLIIVEIFATVGAAILVLGVGVLVIFTSPLTSSLSLLIVTVQVVLNVVLAGVITLLNTILGSLALALSGL